MKKRNNKDKDRAEKKREQRQDRTEKNYLTIFEASRLYLQGSTISSF